MMSEIDRQHYLTLAQVAALFDVCERTIRRWGARPDLRFPPALEALPGRVFFERRAIEGFRRRRPPERTRASARGA